MLKWDELFWLGPPAHERFDINWLDPDAVSQLVVEDIVPWIQSWDETSLAELRCSLEYFLAYDQAFLATVPNHIADLIDDVELMVVVWRQLYVSLFGAAPAAQTRNGYALRPAVLENHADFTSRLPVGPDFTWQTDDWSDSLADVRLQETLALRTTFSVLPHVHSPSADEERRFEVVSQGLVAVRMAFECFEDDPGSLWIPPGPDETVAVVRNHTYLDRLENNIHLLSADVYASPHRLAAEAARGRLTTGNLLDEIRELRNAGHALGIPDSGDPRSDVAAALGIDDERDLPHQPWKSWALLYDAAWAAKDLDQLLLRHN